MAPERYDVAVIGAGIAGLSACVLARRLGLRVICLDNQPHPHSKVGESLDWSSPGLLERIGIDVERLIADGIATYKNKIAVREVGRQEWTATPPSSIRRPPLRFETVTLHVDRAALDARVYEVAVKAGADFLWDRVTGIERADDRVVALTTATQRVEARWYIDASGTARLFSRLLDVPVTMYGRQKVCLWTYFDTPPLYDGTVFFLDNRDRYLSWVWDIPITPRQTSVGFVVHAEHVRERRKAGCSLEKILREELQRHARFHPLLDSTRELDILSTSFQPYVTDRVCGDNWLMVGEAASMPDPLTGNGVTSGIRHARHAVDAIAAAGSDDVLGARSQRMYARHVHRLGRSFNAHIEHAIYRHRLRWGLGMQGATYVYTIFAFFTNAVHARFDPRGRGGMAAFSVWFAAASAWVAGWTLVARTRLWWRNELRP